MLPEILKHESVLKYNKLLKRLQLTTVVDSTEDYAKDFLLVKTSLHASMLYHVYMTSCSWKKILRSGLLRFIWTLRELLLANGVFGEEMSNQIGKILHYPLWITL